MISKTRLRWVITEYNPFGTSREPLIPLSPLIAIR